MKNRGRATRTTNHRAGETITLESLRDFVQITKDMAGDAPVTIREERGQRDAIYYHLTVTETIDV